MGAQGLPPPVTGTQVGSGNHSCTRCSQPLGTWGVPVTLEILLLLKGRSLGFLQPRSGCCSAGMAPPPPNLLGGPVPAAQQGGTLCGHLAPVWPKAAHPGPSPRGLCQSRGLQLVFRLKWKTPTGALQEGCTLEALDGRWSSQAQPSHGRDRGFLFQGFEVICHRAEHMDRTRFQPAPGLAQEGERQPAGPQQRSPWGGHTAGPTAASAHRPAVTCVPRGQDAPAQAQAQPWAFGPEDSTRTPSPQRWARAPVSALACALSTPDRGQAGGNLQDAPGRLAPAPESPQHSSGRAFTRISPTGFSDTH
ncbi:queuosine-tRNA galactosyltransferase isoform 5-T9 [Glossophaga mutica]